MQTGELVWVGKHKRVATFLLARSWIKTYVRNAAGEVSYCTMQLVGVGAGISGGPTLSSCANLLAVQVKGGMNGVRYASVWLSEGAGCPPLKPNAA